MNPLEKTLYRFDTLPLETDFQEPFAEHGFQPIEGDTRPIRQKLADDTTPKIAHNTLYSALGVTFESIHHVNVFSVYGSFVLTAGTQVTPAIALPTGQDWFRLRQWPDGVQAYLHLRQFSCAPTVGTATGSLQVQFQEAGGGVSVPLGDYMANVGGSLRADVLCRNMITDTGLIAIGNLIVNGFGTVTAITFNFSLGFGVAYLHPALRPNEEGCTR